MAFCLPFHPQSRAVNSITNSTLAGPLHDEVPDLISKASALVYRFGHKIIIVDFDGFSLVYNCNCNVVIRNIMHFATTGLFNKSNGKMLSSALSYHFGGIFVLQTDPDHRSKGYATIIIKSMIKELRNRNQIPFATINKNNITSLRLFKTNGFERFDEVFWVTKLD